MEVLVDHSVEGDRARVEHGPAGERRQEPGTVGGEVAAVQRGRDLGEADDGEQEVDIARHRVQSRAGEQVEQVQGPFLLAGVQPQHGRLGGHRRHALGGSELLEGGGLLPQRRHVAQSACPGGGEAVHDGLQVRFAGPGTEFPGGGEQPVGLLDPAVDEGERGATRGGEEGVARLAGFLGERVERAQPAPHGDDVQALPRGGEPPEVAGQPLLGVGEVRRRVGQARGEGQPLGEVVGPPVRDQCGVQDLGEDGGIAQALRGGHCLLRERHRPARIAPVHPRPGQRGGQAAAAHRGDGRRVRLVDQRRDLPRMDAEAQARRQVECRRRHELGVPGLTCSLVGPQQPGPGDGCRVRPRLHSPDRTATLTL